MRFSLAKALVLLLPVLAVAGCDFGGSVATPTPVGFVPPAAVSPQAGLVPVAPNVNSGPAAATPTFTLPPQPPTPTGGVNDLSPSSSAAGTATPWVATFVTPTLSLNALGGCEPTKAGTEGAFYKSDAPVRSSVGQGYILKGVVRESKGCTPVPGAKLEFWVATADGKYDDAHRATYTASKTGTYKFQSSFPPPSEGAPPQIHVRVSAPGYKAVATVYEPRSGQTEGTFDIVLAPAGQ